MKIKQNFKVRNIAGENIVVNFGQLNVDMTRVIALNDTALELWNYFRERDFSKEDVAQYLQNEYEIAAEQATGDAARWVDALAGAKLLEE
ncbi:hypothetical protein BN938_1363 [Mucinivorans hirudinis]|uniref:PqqD family protein n=1 Tax=Mucinivorans hirudinis TaxID=1433126 RepID=A0A060R7X9_9BACT|nr:hypothetical protein BN938_1363 [Mucinivorans hirudinis]